MLSPPVEPMLAKVAEQLPAGGSYLYEPKWDGFRAIVFRGRDDVYIQSRDLKPFDRYFPELHRALLDLLPAGCVVDGEIVIVAANGLDFDALQLRLHPAASRIEKLSKEIPASFVAFDVLAIDDKSVMTSTQSERRAMLEALLHSVQAAALRHAGDARTRRGRELARAVRGRRARRRDRQAAGLRLSARQARHAQDQARAHRGLRRRRVSLVQGLDRRVGSLLLGLYDEAGVLHHVGVTSAFTMAVRKSLARELEPLRQNAIDGHPWAQWQSEDAHASTRMPGGQSRWTGGKDLSWEPLRIERVGEVKYDHLQGDRFRHATHFLRWRPDKPPHDCRYDQLEVTTPFALKKVFAAASR